MIYPKEYMIKETRTPTEYIRQRIKETKNYYGAHGEKQVMEALEILFGQCQINSPAIREAAEILGWKEEYYNIFPQKEILVATTINNIIKAAEFKKDRND